MLEHFLNRLRKAGWQVAIHNDYIQDGKKMTFWLFTHPCGAYVKGEANNDADAVATCAYLASLCIINRTRFEVDEENDLG